MKAAPMADRSHAHWLFLLSSYALLSAVPFAPWLLGQPIKDTTWLVGIECLSWFTVWAVFKRPKYFHWLLLPAFLLLPADAYLYQNYGGGVSGFHLAMITETNFQETMEFLGPRLVPVLLATALVFGWWLLTYRAARRTEALDWKGPSRKWALIGMVVVAAVVAREEPRAASMQLPWERAALSDTRPFGLFAAVVEYGIQLKRLEDLSEDSRGFRFGAHPRHPGNKPIVVVLVIGESSRFDRWSLNGYARETNPLLGRETNLITAPDMLASASATMLSVPTLLSRRKAEDTFKSGFREKSVIAAFKEAGFKTWWLSNQLPFGRLDTPISVFSKQADVAQFLNAGGYADLSSLDGILAEPYAEALADPAPKKLIILHTLGNHWNYARRYPPEFDHWQPSLSGLADPDHTDVHLKDRINNSYDNSVLYVDWFLAHVIAPLKASGQPSVMLYSSDHGENLHDGTCDYVLHGHNSQYDFHIPMLVWYSDAYATEQPHKVALLKRNLKEKLTTENNFESLVDIADIGYPGQRLEWSFASDRFTPHTRYVDSYGWADYDRSTFRGDCREVIDPHAARRIATRF
jgi:glucan phosphoethanolaminetransferase (alkaline phosphatase superfamily)